MPEVIGDENRIGLTGEGRAAFIKSAIDACNKSRNSGPPTNCSCYANAMADSVSIKGLKETATPGNREAAIIALRPKIDAAAKRCLTNPDALADACPFRKSYPDVLVMQPRQDRNGDNGARSLDGPMQGRIFL